LSGHWHWPLAIAVLCRTLGLSRAGLCRTAGVVGAQATVAVHTGTPVEQEYVPCMQTAVGWQGHHLLDTCIGHPRCNIRLVPQFVPAQPAGKCQRCYRFRFDNLRQFHTRSPAAPAFLLRARRPIALAALASGASARTTNLEGSVQVVRGHFFACTLRPGTARGTSSLLRAAGVPITGRGLGTKGAGRGTGVGAVAGIGLSVSNPCMKGHRKQFPTAG